MWQKTDEDMMDGILPKLTAQNGSRVAQEQVDKQQKEYHLIGRQRKVSGHTLFEFNRKTKEIRTADISREVIVGMDGNPIYKTKTDVNQDCFYLQALNVKNAKKKLVKLGLL